MRRKEHGKACRQVQQLTDEITGELKLQKRIVETYWKEKFNEPLDTKGMSARGQQKLF